MNSILCGSKDEFYLMWIKGLFLSYVNHKLKKILISQVLYNSV